MPKDPILNEDDKEIKGEEPGAKSAENQDEADTEHLLPEHNNDKTSDSLGETKQPPLLEVLKAELVETKERLLRLAADFDNFKKISHREQQSNMKFANESLLANLLPIVDSLEHAVSACKKSEESNKDVVIGVEIVLKQLSELLRKSGIEVFSALGQQFDPARHEAMGEQLSDEVDEGSVIVEYQKGYLLHGRLLRPARVVLARRSGK